MLRVGNWCVDPPSGRISRDGESVRLDERSMRLLLCLAARPGQVVSIDDLLQQVWPGVTVSPDSVYQAVAALRRQLGDDSRQPAYIATVPRLGYRLVAEAGPWADAPAAANRLRTVLALAIAALCLVVAAAFVFRSAPPPRSIAVLPFLDLTEHMKEEEFADGMTEELIDKLSKVPGVRVPPPTSSFYYKGKQVPVADIARALGVGYILDGSVRKSGGRVRVAARLVRPDIGYVAWSETYDRPWADIVAVQDDIAGEVTKALRASISEK